MSLYPLALTGAFWQRQTALVVGGGRVAERRTRGLLAVGARVVVIAPTLTPGLTELVAQGGLEWLARLWQPDDLATFPQARLILAATNDRATNAAIGEAARLAGRLVNLADDPAQSDFVLPGVVRRGPLTLAINTGDGEQASSPALTAHLRRHLTELVGPEWGELAALLAALRPVIKARVAADRQPPLWEALVTSPALALLANGETVAARQLLADLVEQAVQP